ncbi:hypothetical protein HNQ91_001568 [Filimonas zeae]|uniref:Uncharacterized protein n=1 Tax=Filimonas zeae TaxID=1737353 RepID=A0A917MWD1_9BACT|nr:hypothetical protein [Filimonas zeae]MDR6338517.1 hypothetical protein [Filimonas zeae]GGH67870.1 hypothetical protein GCM10011379_23600 [Filimonas zeae]
MKNRVTLALLLCALTTVVHAQFYKSVLPAPAGFNNALEKIVLDFRYDYKTIQGQQLSRETEVESYTSAVQLPGAKECVITRFHSKQDTTASWQGVMYRGDNYKEAVRVYKSLVRQVKRSQMQWLDNSAVYFLGDLEEPKEEVGFANTVLSLDVADAVYRQFVAEVELSGNDVDWTVTLNFHKKRDDREQ